MSDVLFLIVIDWIMKKTTEDSRNGIRWKFTITLEEIDFADDVGLLSSRLDHAHKKLSILSQFGRNEGLKVNTEKTKVERSKTISIKNRGEGSGRRVEFCIFWCQGQQTR